MLACAVMVHVAACGTEPEAEPRYLEDDGAAADASVDARRDRYAPCDECEDAANDAPTEGGDGGVCLATNACASARDIGKVSGDSNADQLTAKGSVSEWLSLRVTEDATLTGASLKVKLTLLSPTDENFDLFVHYDPLMDVVKCAPPASASSTQQAGISDSVSLSWGEGVVPNGGLDDRTLRIEVRHVSGACKPGAEWTLIVQGNL